MAPTSTRRQGRGMRLALLGLAAAAATIPAATAEAYSMNNCVYFVNGAEHLNGTPLTVVVNENLDVPKELCDGSLHVRVDFEETSGVIHVRVFSTKTGKPISEGFKIRVPL